jgi:hypothetical protein
MTPDTDITSPFGPAGIGTTDRRNDEPIFFVLVTLCCLGLAFVILWDNGTFIPTCAFLALCATILLTLYRIDVGFTILMFAALLFGQFEVPGFNTLTFRISYFKNLKEVPFIPYFTMGDASFFELHFLFVIAVWIVLLCLKKDFRARPVALWFPATMWFVWLIAAFAFGMSRGGDFLPALWETRALMYLGIVYLFVPQVIRTKAHITAYFWISIIAITYKAFEGIARYQGNGWSMSGYEAMQAHEDPLLIATLFFLLLGLTIFGGNRRQKWFLLFFLLPLLLGFYVGNRRAAYAAFCVSFAAYLFLIPGKSLLRALKYIVPVVVLLGTYTAVFWDSEGSGAGPIQQIKSGFDKDESGGEQIVKDRNYYSNLYRKIEDYDLAITIQNSPGLGIGFGTKYEQPIDLVPLNFALRDYMAHNNVLWLLAKGGVLGFSLFWFFLNSIAFRGASLLPRLKDPYLQTVCALSVICVITLVTAAFFDLHFVRYRTMIYFGSLLGLIASVQNLTKDDPSLLTQPGTPVPALVDAN